MDNGDKITVLRAIFLENWLMDNYNNNMSYDDIKKLILKNFKGAEAQYLLDAFKIPITDMMNKIRYIDDNNNYNNNILVAEIQKRYPVDRAFIFKRAHDVRIIINYLDHHPEINFPKITFYDKLVRDNVINMLEGNGDKVIYSKASGTEFLDYLLKYDSECLDELKVNKNSSDTLKILADKLEIIKEYALYFGYDLDDIMKCCLKKNNKQGSFSKKLVLKEVHNK